jgi:TIR domain
MARKHPPFLHLVERLSEPRRVRPEDFAPSSWQRTLFARKNPALLAFVDIERASETDFLTVLVGAQARFVIDLRLVPRFDVGGMNRKLIFSVFGQTGTQYVDIAGRLGLNESRDARLNPPILLGHLQRFVFTSGGPVDGPVVFLVDAEQFEDAYVNSLADLLSALRPHGWEVLRVPFSLPETGEKLYAQQARRRVVFISHANPEDNAFTIWLSARLACAGYEVWSDIANLLGGEEFWDNIEEAIRRHSAKVVAVLSRRAQQKKGVLDEINCAISVERMNWTPFAGPRVVGFKV